MSFERKYPLSMDDMFNSFVTMEQAFNQQKTMEAYAEKAIERKFMKEENSDFYIPFEDVPIRWKWTWPEVDWFIELWQEGLSLKEIAEILERKPIEVALMIMSCDYERRIKPR